jgi:GNAT superfamily N-acetyltransferase
MTTKGIEQLPQIGFARLITDETTFAYLTDVYILPAYTGKGLGKQLISCVKDQLDQWPHLRGILLYADAGKAVEFYEKFLGTREFTQGEGGLKILCRWDDASPLTHKEASGH